MKLNILIHIFVLAFLSSCLGNKTATTNESVGSMAISSPSALDTSNNSITYTIYYKNAKEVTLQETDVELIKTGTVTGTLSVNGSGLTTRTVTVSGISGVGTIAIRIGAGTATYAKSKKSASVGPSSIFTAANLPPAISVSAPNVSRTKNGPVTYTVTYTGASAIYLDPSYISLVTDGSASGSVAVTGTGPIKTVTISSITGAGSLGIVVAADSAIGPTGVLAAATASSVSTIVDITPPVMTVSSPTTSVTKAGPVYYTVSYNDASAITLSVANITLNTTGTAAGVVDTVSGTGSSRTVKISSITGNGTLSISIAASTATDSVGNETIAYGPSTAFAADQVPPSIALSAPSVTTTNTGPVTYTVTYTGASSISLSSSNIVLQKTGTANATVAVTGSGTTTRTVTLSSITGDGTLGISLAAGTALDAAGNSALVSATSTSFAVDNTTTGIAFSAPSLTSTNSASVSYTVTYTDAASISLIDSDVTLVKTGTANAVATVTGSGTLTRTITLTTITGNGTIALRLIAGTAIDSSGNIAIASGTSAAFTVDNIEPIIAVSPPSTTLTAGGPITYTISYTGATGVTLANGNVTLNTTGTATGTVNVTGSGTTSRTVTISGITGDGTLGISLAAGTASDDVGNLAVSTPASATFTVDNTKPTMTFSAPSRLATTNSTVVYTVTYAGASSVSLVNANLSLVATGTATGTISVSGSGTVNRNVSITGISGNGTIGLSAVAGTATDTVGNLADAPTASSTIYVTDDPIFSQSWHLYNYGQSGFSSGFAVTGVDLNLLTSWKSNYKGAGIKILVSDTGFESAHEDLSSRFLAGTVHHDYTKGISPDWLWTDSEPILYEPHGTAVAGLIAATAENAKGGSGVAPAASLGSANILEAASVGTTELLAQADNAYDIINQSWGTTQCNTSAPNATYVAKLASDRKIYVKASGNDFSVDLAKCSRPTKSRHGLSVFDPYNNNPYTIVVGAINASGVKASYSSPGSNLWISGIGGEDGATAPAMLTTDITGCTFGSAPLENVNSFQVGTHPLNINCNYTSNMSGTSAATPTVSGAIAILLSANGSLTTRDVKHILATTATKINSSATASANAYVSSPLGHVWQQAWVTNGAGYNFNNNYGFGLINVDAAVTMATNAYAALGAEVQAATSSGALALAIPDASATGVESSLVVASNLTIEAIQITPSITHANIGQIGLELTSPQGTKSILMNINNSLDGVANLSTEVFLSNAFYGENSAGTWKLKVIDGATPTTGTLTGWTIRVTGH